MEPIEFGKAKLEHVLTFFVMMWGSKLSPEERTKMGIELAQIVKGALKGEYETKQTT